MAASDIGVPAPWMPGEIHADVIAGVAVLAAAYLWAWRRRGIPVSPSHAGCFTAGLVVILVALNGPLHDLSDRYLFSAHMVQHLLLTLVLPPLLLAGLPSWLADDLIRLAGRSRPSALIVACVTRPLPAFALYAVALIGWHLPGPYGAALGSHAWHVIEHLTLIATSTLAWWPVLSPSTLAPPLPYGAQILYLFVFGMPMTVVAAMITAAEEVLYPFYALAPRVTTLTALEDQRLGGIVMWVPAGLIPLVAFTIVFFRWVAAEAEPSGEGEDALR
jgi:putative membrane protein